METINSIEQKICDHLGVVPEFLKETDNSTTPVMIRTAISKIAKDLCGATCLQLRDHFNKKCHTTILSYWKRMRSIEDVEKYDPVMFKMYTECINLFKNK